MLTHICISHLHTWGMGRRGKDLFCPTLPGLSPSWQYMKPWQQEPGVAGRCVRSEAAEAWMLHLDLLSLSFIPELQPLGRSHSHSEWTFPLRELHIMGMCIGLSLTITVCMLSPEHTACERAYTHRHEGHAHTCISLGHAMSECMHGRALRPSCCLCGMCTHGMGDEGLWVVGSEGSDKAILSSFWGAIESSVSSASTITPILF